jgi:hypothetical protein
MHRLSKHAIAILDRMEWDRHYEPEDLRALAPEMSIEHLREIVHELWVNRQVERVGHSGCRRHASGPAQASQPALRQTKVVRPEELFDHDTFADFFK